MAEPQGEYQSMEDKGPSAFVKIRHCCGKWLSIIFLVTTLLLVSYQAAKYYYAVMGCSPGNLKHYDYPFGTVNLLPQYAVLVEQQKIWHDSFAVYPADVDGLMKGGSIGQFYRIWGPIFYTYAYQTIESNTLLWIRPALISIGDAYLFERCDDKGGRWEFGEGVHYLENMVRSVFGMFVTAEYNVYNGSTLKAISQKVGQGGQSQVIFAEYTSGNQIASGLLNDRHYHGQYDKWFVEDKKTSLLPAYVTQSITVLAAFDSLDAKRAKEGNSSSMPFMLFADFQKFRNSTQPFPNSTRMALKLPMKDAAREVGTRSNLVSEANIDRDEPVIHT